MSQRLISLNPDLKRLRDRGYSVSEESGYLVLRGIPYVNSSRTVTHGILMSKLELSGDKTNRPADHTVYFVGSFPCNADGSFIQGIGAPSEQRTQLFGDIIASFRFSTKPASGYVDYFEKMDTYATILSSRAQQIDALVTAKAFNAIESSDGEATFHYLDTASSRYEISAISGKLETGPVAIIGLGGTGAYVLDLLAKTPVKGIHLFDKDEFQQHNAFRTPGAASIEDLKKKMPKVEYLASIYGKMRRGIFPTNAHVTAENAHLLDPMSFVFICIDSGPSKLAIIERLESKGIPFIDVGMGVQATDGALCGIVRTTLSTPEKREHVRNNSRISFSDDGQNEYRTNIQIAELNALNATLAVIKWKKQLGFYHDLEKEHHSTYTIDGNLILNEDKL